MISAAYDWMNCWNQVFCRGAARQNAVTENFLCIAHTVEHNYISSSSTVGIQLHVSALYVGHLQVVI